MTIPDSSFSGLPTSTPNTSIIGGQDRTTSTSNYKYKLNDIPTFDGSVASFPEFLREWQECVIPGKQAAWVIRNLNERTPKKDDLSVFTEVKDAIDHLKSKYANPVQVANTTMDSFMKLNKVEGANDQQRLVNLEMLTSKQ